MSDNNSKTYAIFSILFVLISVVCVSYVVSLSTSQWAGLDLTEDKLYTLSKGSENIINKIDMPLTMSLYYSKSAVNKRSEDYFSKFNNYYYYVRDLLKNYERIGKNKIIFKEYDPRPYSDAEALALDHNIQRFDISKEEGFFFGISITSESGLNEALPFLNPDDQALIEYKISEMIDNASTRKKNKLGILSSLEVTAEELSPYMRQMLQAQGQRAPQSWFVTQEIKKYYDIKKIDAAAETIDGIDYLLIIHPKKLSEKTLFAIDQYIMKGGKAVIFVDPFCFNGDQPKQDPQNPYAAMGHSRSSSLNKLMTTWGLSLKEGLQFAGDNSLSVPESFSFVGEQRYDSVKNCFNSKEIISSNLNNIEMLFPGILEKTEGSESHIVPLITTTATGNSWTANLFELARPDAPALQKKFTPSDKKLWLAAMITGRLKTSFPDGIKNEVQETEDNKNDKKLTASVEGISQSETSNTIIVVADVDMLTNQSSYSQNFFGVTPRNKNSSFVLNCLQYIAGSTDLISVRSRGKYRRPFTVIEEKKKEAEKKIEVQVNEFQNKINGYQEELNGLQSEANEDNIQLLQSKAITRRRELEKKIRQEQRELRKAQEQNLKSTERLSGTVKLLSCLTIPSIILIMGCVLAVVRINKRKSSLTRRNS